MTSNSAVKMHQNGSPLTIENLSKGVNHHKLNIYNARYHGESAAMSNSRYGNGAPLSHMISHYIGSNDLQNSSRCQNRSQGSHQSHQSNHQMSSLVNRIKPEKCNRRNVQKLTWRSSHWVKGFGEEDESCHQSGHMDAMSVSDVSPNVAIRRILLLYENLQYREAASFINRLNYCTFRAIVTELPIDVLVESIPNSLPILEALYAKVFLCTSDGLTVSFKFLHPENVIMQMVRLFALQNPNISADNTNCLLQCIQERLDTNHPVVGSCKKLLKVCHINLCLTYSKAMLMSLLCNIRLLYYRSPVCESNCIARSVRSTKPLREWAITAWSALPMTL